MLDRRRVLKALAGLFLSGFGVGGAYALGWEPVQQQVKRYRLTPQGWPSGRKLTVAALADLHIGGPNMSVARVAEIVATTNLLKPDLIVLLGDFVASRARDVGDPPYADWAEELAKLDARDGVFAILGNHDWWHDERAMSARAGPTLVGRALQAAGVTLLENKALRLETGSGPIWLAGLGDQIAFQILPRGRRGGIDDLAGTLAQVADDDAPLIMLAHEPDVFARMPQRVALTMSGHTHGGQVRLFGWSPVVPSHYGNRYAYGHVRENGHDLIVSGGLGTSKLPIRLGVPPEIVLVELG